MQYRFPCGHCGRQLKANTEIVGKSVKCPACKKPITIPPPPSEDEVSAPATTAAEPARANVSEPTRLPQIKTEDATVKSRVPQRRSKSKKPVWLWLVGAAAMVGLVITAIVFSLRSPDDAADLATVDHSENVVPPSGENFANGTNDANPPAPNRPSPANAIPVPPESAVDPQAWNELGTSIAEGRKKAEAEGAIVRVTETPGGTVTTIDEPFPYDQNEETAKVDATAKSPAQWLAEVRDVSVNRLDRGKALAALRKLGADAVPAVSQAFNHPRTPREENYLCRTLIVLLVRMASDDVSSAREEVQRLMEGPDRKELKGVAASAMLTQGVDTFVDMMLGYLKHEDASTRYYAFWFVTRVGPPLTVEHAVEVAQFLESKQGGTRMMAFRAIEEAGEEVAPVAIPALLKRLDDPDPKFQLEVLYLIHRLHPERYPELKQPTIDAFEAKFEATDDHRSELYLTLEILLKRLKK